MLITGMTAALATWCVSVLFKFGPVAASAGLSLIVSLFFIVFPDLISPYLTRHIPIVFFGASFGGMTSPTIINSRLLIAFSGLVFSLIYLNASRFFAGMGSGLGTTACISVLVMYSVKNVLKKFLLEDILKQH